MHLRLKNSLKIKKLKKYKIKISLFNSMMYESNLY